MMAVQHRICFVICYFGRWPEWIRLYLESCRHNPSIDFLFFTDCGVPDNVPDNVTIIESTLGQFQARAREKLELPIVFENAYKLCDFKPTFGIMFSEFLEGYDFWGNADIDIIYGNIRDFLTPELLEKNDIVSSRKEYLAGHLTLYRNKPEINHLFKQSSDFPRVLTEPEHFSFCECSKLWRQLHDGESILDNEPRQAGVRCDGVTIIDSMTHVVTRMQNAGRLNASFSTMIKDRPELQEKNWKLYWNQGILSDVETKESFLYFHMIGLKDRTDFQIPHWEDIPEQYYITRKGFSIDGRISESVLLRLVNMLKTWSGRKPYNPIPY